jgi:nucleotide-binding universal stress UspA family protein
MVPDLVGPVRERGQALLTRLRSKVVEAGIKVETSLVESVPGHLAEIICAAACASLDIIVMGARPGRVAGRIIQASNVERVARQSAVPVMLVPATVSPPSSAAAKLDPQTPLRNDVA